ncbi:MAG: N-acetyltransferase family protein [Acetobacteraceae bacterium]
MTPVLRHADTADDIAACFPVMHDLRPHLTDAAELITRVAVQRQESYRILAAWTGDQVVGLAGYRFQHNLIRGRFCYVDDLVVRPDTRRHRLGARLLDAVAEVARAEGCAALVLDTGLDNLLGQRFYFRYGMLPAALRFALRWS